MEKETIPSYAKTMYQKLRPEAKIAFNKLDKSFQEMYSTNVCQMCGAHLTIRQQNRIIIEGVPPICAKDYKQMHSKMEELVTLFNQLKLF